MELEAERAAEADADATFRRRFVDAFTALITALERPFALRKGVLPALAGVVVAGVVVAVAVAVAVLELLRIDSVKSDAFRAESELGSESGSAEPIEPIELFK